MIASPDRAADAPCAVRFDGRGAGAGRVSRAAAGAGRTAARLRPMIRHSRRSMARRPTASVGAPRRLAFPERRCCARHGRRRWIRPAARCASAAGRWPAGSLHEGFHAFARGCRKEGQGDQGRERTPRAAGRGLQADRQLRGGRSQDDQLRREEFRKSAESRRRSPSNSRPATRAPRPC